MLDLILSEENVHLYTKKLPEILKKMLAASGQEEESA